MPKVLLIEDSHVQAHWFAAMLETGAYAVERAESLREGLERIRQGDIDAVLLDLTLPDSDGLETVIAVRSQAARTPVVVLTGLDDESTAAAALQKGAQDYLVKSEVNQNWLIRSVQHAIVRMTPRRTAVKATPAVDLQPRSLVDLRKSGAVWVIRLLEKHLLDGVDIALLSQQLNGFVDEGCRKMAISFVGVDYASNGALSALLAVRKKMRTANGELRLCSLSPSIYEHMSCRQFHKLFEIVADEDAAIASLGPL